MKNKKIMIILAVLSFVMVLPVFSRQGAIAQEENGRIGYWTCSMHPQVKSDKPGKCPICAMALIPVYEADKDKTVIGEASKDTIGLISRPAEYRHLKKLLRLPGKVNHDYELYTLEQEYLSALSGLDKLKESADTKIIQRQQALVDSVGLRLKLLGLSDEQINELARLKAPQESLIYPSKAKAWIQADIYEQDLSTIKPGQKAVARIKGYDGEFTGRIYAIEEVLNPQSRSAKARVEVDSPGELLKHEAYAEVSIEVDMGKRLSIPRQSLIDTGTRKVVYLDLGEGRYQLAGVETGEGTSDFIEVLQGVKEGDLVVTEGNFLLDSQTTLTGGQALLYGAAEEVKEEKETKEQKHRH